MNPDGCDHSSVKCVNQYELIRKYQCDFCGHVMMCSCEEEFARKYLPHQITFGTDYSSKEQVLVTLGFQTGICNACKGLPLETHPMAEIHGRTTKISRYYWREIAFATIEKFAEWAGSSGFANWTDALLDNQEKYKSIERNCIVEIQQQHDTNPLYSYSNLSQAEVIERYGIEVIDVDGTYIQTHERGVRLWEENSVLTPETFAEKYFSNRGYNVIFTESRPFHVLFGVFFWMLIQDPSDPKNRIVAFGNRFSFDKGEDGETVYTFLPEDFGSEGYFRRRETAIDEHMSMIRQNQHDLLGLFDYWLQPSNELRQYLWAHHEDDLAKARQIVEVLPEAVVVNILRYLIESYWQRYLGWPDLLLFKNGEILFVEVKSSKDKLKDDQKSWIKDNYEFLHLPFKILKIHKASQVTINDTGYPS